MYNSARENVANTLKCAKAVSITTDAWTSINNESFPAVTAHITKKSELKSYLLDCFEFSGKHTGYAMAAEIIRFV